MTDVEPNDIIVGLPPIIDQTSKVLILGTFPSEPARRAGEYYSDARNKFWDIIFSLFSHSILPNYSDKVGFIQQHNIGIWDVFRAAHRTRPSRKNNGDKYIEYSIANDFTNLFSDYPALRCIVFNGNSTYRFFTRRIDIIRPPYVYPRLVSSSSDANTESFETKVASWQRLMPFLEELASS